MLKLILPRIKYIKSLREAHREQLEYGEISKEIWDRILSDLSDPKVYVKSIIDKADGVGLSPHQVPVIRYWLIDNDKYIGTLGLRKELTSEIIKREGNIGFQIRPSMRGKGYGTKILELGLEKAKEVGLESVYLNCSKNNTASKRIIEKNGGRLLSTSIDSVSGEKSLHYVISF